jgi:hypothetical protein
MEEAMKRFAIGMLALLCAAPILAAQPPEADKLPNVSVVSDARVIRFDGETGYLGQVGAQLQLHRWFAVRGTVDLNATTFDTADVDGEPGAEIAVIGILPWRLEAIVGAGLWRYDVAGETESDIIYRAGLSLRAVEMPHAALVVGIGSQRIDPDEGDAETDIYWSVGFRGR